MSKNNKTVVLGITSSIAAFKVIDLIKNLKKEGIEVIVIMTKHAAEMVSPSEFEKASGNKVHLELFETGFDYKTILENRKVEHIEIAEKADVFAVVPATANTIAKIAHGIADDFLTSTLLACTSPIIICPAMNVNMWNNPFTQNNIKKLKQAGIQIIEPSEGMLACGYEGKGKLEEINIIAQEIQTRLIRTNSLHGKKILITSGGTSEKIDDVRFITNRSSGKMGAAIAQECYLRGAAEVLLLRTKTSVKPGYKIAEKEFNSAGELYELIKNNIKNFDIIFHAAAVSDFKIEQPFTGKISSDNSLNLKLVPQIKISDEIKKIHPSIKLIAFKAEYNLSKQNLIKAAEQKLQDCNADAIIANDISKKTSGFEADSNEVTIVLKNKTVKNIPLASKQEVAKEIIEYLLKSKTFF
jgi:phosphopantothenoylcysteine decarboxylase/phosphopantothenate--cysteine ligase